MAPIDPDDDAQPTQTTPEGLEIPVPTRDEFLRNMAKVAPPLEPPEDKRSGDAEDAGGQPELVKRNETVSVRI
jgi:hypothetical protein